MKVTVFAVLMFGLVGRCQSFTIPVQTPDYPSSTPSTGSAGAGAPNVRDASVPERDASSPAAPDASVVDAGAAEAPAADGGTTALDACQGPPGMFADDACERLADGLTAYTPNYELWADGANKERYIYLPAGAQIDTSNPDRWTFPVGTRIYKTFRVDGLKVETRMIEKHAAAPAYESWTFTAYVWSADQRHVQPAAAAGENNVLGTAHDVPSQQQCQGCHSQTGLDAVNGFGAVQLNHQKAGWNLGRLIAEQKLVNGAGGALNVDTQRASLPGDAKAQAALGYLHGNCAHCHGGPSPRAGMSLMALTGMTDVANAPAYAASCSCLKRWTGRLAKDGSAITLRITPGAAAHSGIIGRMSVRKAGEQMPPLGTELVDNLGVAAVSAWIDELDPYQCGETEPVCPLPTAAAGMGGAAGGGAGMAAAAGSRAP